MANHLLSKLGSDLKLLMNVTRSLVSNITRMQTIASRLFLCHHCYSTRSTIQLTRISTSRRFCEKTRVTNAASDLPCLNYLGSKVHNQKADPTRYHSHRAVRASKHERQELILCTERQLVNQRAIRNERNCHSDVYKRETIKQEHSLPRRTTQLLAYLYSNQCLLIRLTREPADRMPSTELPTRR
jgi:hypothetical protein